MCFGTRIVFVRVLFCFEKTMYIQKCTFCLQIVLVKSVCDVIIKTPKERGGKMKILLFADYHYYPKHYINHGIEGLHKLQKAAEDNNCDMMLHLGDMTHGPTTVMDFVKEYTDFHIPSYSCLGNHDTELSTRDEVVKAYKMPDHHYILDKGGYRFIIANTSYYQDGDKIIPYDGVNYQSFPKTRETLPEDEIEFIKNAIETSPYPCILCSHGSFERYHCVKNRQRVLDIIDQANKKKPHSVIMVMNGHHHKDNISIINNVIYYDVTSSIFDCAGCPPMPPHQKYKKEDYDEYCYAGWMVCCTEPLYSVVTLEGTTVTIEGCEPCEMYMGVHLDDIGFNRYDHMGRSFEPYVTSAKITLG